MRKLIYHVGTTLDNFICQEDRSIAGFFADGDHIPDYLDSLKNYDTVLMGKATYEFGYGFGLKPGMAPYANMKNFVFSQSIKIDGPLDDRLTIVRDDSVSFIKDLKNKEGTPIYLCGGGIFASSLLDNNLIDALIIKLNPVLLGRGIRLFERSSRSVELTLTDTKIYNSGVVLLTYVIKGWKHS
ncbi:MAG TPA: dihydrofolate reductase family protein [Chryseolinea sp.]|nr:dihydrofolate reductase family protein [Chryseolinea sp.]